MGGLRPPCVLSKVANRLHVFVDFVFADVFQLMVMSEAVQLLRGLHYTHTVVGFDKGANHCAFELVDASVGYFHFFLSLWWGGLRPPLGLVSD